MNAIQAGATPDVQIIIDANTEPEPVCQGSENTLVSKEGILHMLDNEARSLTGLLTDAVQANPVQMAVNTSDELTQRPYANQWLDVLQMASQDFPTKYAYFVAETVKLTN